MSSVSTFNDESRTVIEWPEPGMPGRWLRAVVSVQPEAIPGAGPFAVVSHDSGPSDLHTASLHISDPEVLEQHARAYRHAAALLRGDIVVEGLAGTPAGHEFADVLDAARADG